MKAELRKKSKLIAITFFYIIKTWILKTHQKKFAPEETAPSP